MHVIKTDLSSTEVKLHITATAEDLEPIKQQILKKLAKNVKVAGFRVGKVPPQIAEKNIDQQLFQTEFLDEAMTQLYAKATQIENVRPLSQPKVDIKKFVPFTTLEYEVTTSVVSKITLGKYKSLKSNTEIRKVTEKDLKTVLENLQTRMATKNSVDRPAKKDDEAVIDFSGADAKGQPINGADGKDYPLLLGSNAFIPGFEDNVIGMKAGQEKAFTLTFPNEYGVKALASKKVAFTVNVKTVNELIKPALNDDFAPTVGPFKTVNELEADIMTQLESEAQQENARIVQNGLVGQVVDTSKVDLPAELIDQQIEFEREEVRRNATYRGQTYQELLDIEGVTEEEFTKNILRPRAETQVKTAFILGEIAEVENIFVTPEELEVQMQILKGQYTDPAMQAELEKDQARSDIAGRILSQKVVNFITDQMA